MPLSKTALASIFRRSGAAGEHTMLYDDAPTGMKQHVERVLREAGFDDEPIVLTMFSSDDWSVITTRSLFVTRDRETQIVTADTILKVEPAWREGAFRKTGLDTLAVSLRDGDTLLMRTDQGGPFSGVWNVLKTFEAEAAKATATS